MKKHYEQLIMEVMLFERQDIVTASDIVMEWDIFENVGAEIFN